MATDPTTYLAEVELALVASQVIFRYEVMRSWANTDDGYISVRATLINGDFLEAAESFTLERGRLQITDYRYQWMDASRTTLRRRWDCAPHHSGLEGFPHRVHVDSEDRVLPAQPFGLIDLLQRLEAEMP